MRKQCDVAHSDLYITTHTHPVCTGNSDENWLVGVQGVNKKVFCLVIGIGNRMSLCASRNEPLLVKNDWTGFTKGHKFESFLKWCFFFSFLFFNLKF